jgi:hypothetical protein
MPQPATQMGAIAGGMAEAADLGEEDGAELAPRRPHVQIRGLISRSARGRVDALQAHTRPHS